MYYGYIYLTTNKENNMKYIGKHKSSEFDPKYFGSGKILLQSLYKVDEQGRRIKQSHKFTCEVLQWCVSKEELNYYEEHYINKYDAVNSTEFYNLTQGGTGDSVKGLIYVTNGVVNKKIFPQELPEYEKQGFHKGGPKPSKEAIEKRRLSNTGKKRDPETGKKISAALTGKTPSDEARKHLSESHKGITSYKKGKICVTNGNEYIFIEPLELQSYLDKGYIKKGHSHKNPEESSKNYSNARKNKTVVNDGNRYYYISKDKVTEYLEKGYTLGKPKCKSD